MCSIGCRDVQVHLLSYTRTEVTEAHTYMCIQADMLTQAEKRIDVCVYIHM